MTAIEAVAGCRWRRGRSALLVIAPHGGRRDPLPPGFRSPHGTRARKVNDLHTADLAEELAEALDAGFIVNPVLDRNQLDLNRISQVAAHAPWFLTLIETLLEPILARHACAEVLFVHGWNVIQPKCDVGIGHALADADAARLHADALTVSSRYAAERLADLQTACAEAGIATAFGERYAARHPNNLLQLFRHAERVAPLAPRLAEWTAARRVEAVQLELGVPLRWPGGWRRDFVRAAAAAFAGRGDVAASAPLAAPMRSGDALRRAQGERMGARGEAKQVRGQRKQNRGERRQEVERRRSVRPGGTSVRAELGEAPGGVEPAPTQAVATPPASLQVYDPQAELGLSARVDNADGRTAGRLLLFLGRQRLALFIGEDAGDKTSSAGGPHFTPAADGFRLGFAGAALACDDGTLYVDLEQAFAASRLCAVAVDVQFRKGLSDDYGLASGWVEVDGVRLELDAPAFARHPIVQRTLGAWSSQITLSAAFGPERALRVRHEFPGAGGALHELTARGGASHAVPSVHVCFDGDGGAPEQIAAGNLLCEPLSRMAITRPLAPRRLARVVFGTARFRCETSTGFGFYEYARALA